MARGKFTFKVQMVLVFSIFVVLLLLDIKLMKSKIGKVFDNNEYLTDVLIPSLNYVSELKNITQTSEYFFKSKEYLNNEYERKNFSIKINNVIPEIEDTLVKLKSLIKDSILVKDIDTVLKTSAVFFEKEGKFLRTYEDVSSASDSLKYILLEDNVKELSHLKDKLLSDLIVLQNRLKEREIFTAKKNSELFEQNKSYTITVRVFIVVFLLIIFIFLYLGFMKNITMIKDVLIDMSRGKLPKEKLKEKGNEMGEIIQALNVYIDNIRNTAKFAIEVGKKNYDKVNFKPVSEYDELGKALVMMKDDLEKAEKEEKLRKIEDEHRRWISDGLANFAEVLRKNNDNLQRLGEEVVRNLVYYLNANIGALYILRDDENEKYLEPISVYAYNRKKILNNKIYLGEGLVGTCALEGEKIFLTDIPDDYVKIRSGLGESKPRSILLVPLKINEEVHGVLELASINVFEDYQIEFIEKLAESLASTLKMTMVNVRTQELLEQSRQQAEELATQEEEMRQNLEELMATQEELARQKAEIESIFEAIKKSTLYAEFDKYGRLIKVSDLFLEILGVDRSVAKDVSISKYFEKDDFQKLLERLKKGEIVTVEFIVAGRWIRHTFSPVYDTEGNLMKILDIAVDVSEEKELKEQLKNCK